MTHNRNILAIENQLLVNQSQINNLIQTIQFVQNIHNHQLRHSLVKIQTKYQAYVNLIAEFTNKRREYFLKMMDIISNKQKLLKQIAKSNVREFYNPVKSWVSGGVKNRENIAILRSFLELSLNYTRYRDSRSILNNRLNTLYKAVGDLQTSIMKALQNFVQSRVTVDFNRMKSNNEMLLNKLVLHEGELYNNEKDLFKIEKQYRDVFGIENEYVTMLAPYVGRVNNLFMATTSGGGKLDLGGGDAEAVLSSSAIIPDLRAGDVYSMAGLLQHQLKGCEYALNQHANQPGATLPEMIRKIMSNSDINQKMSQLTDVIVNGKLALFCETLKYSVNKNSEMYKALNDNDKASHNGYSVDPAGNPIGDISPTRKNLYWGANRRRRQVWWESSYVGRIEYVLCMINEIINQFAMRGFITLEGMNAYYLKGAFSDMRGGYVNEAFDVPQSQRRVGSAPGMARPLRASAPPFVPQARRPEVDQDELRRSEEARRARALEEMRIARGQRQQSPDERARRIKREARARKKQIDDQAKQFQERIQAQIRQEGEAARQKQIDDQTAEFQRRLSSNEPDDEIQTPEPKLTREQRLEKRLREVERHDDEKWVGEDDRFADMFGGARTTRKARKSYKTQKGGAALAVPPNLSSLRSVYQVKAKTNSVTNRMFGNALSILDTLRADQDKNLFGFRPMVRPESLTSTLGAVLQQVRNSSVSNEKTLAGVRPNGLPNSLLFAARNNNNPLIGCYDIRQNARDGSYQTFGTIEEFATHLQERLGQLQGVLGQMWKVHDTYSQNISKVSALTENTNPRDINKVQRLWENMNDASAIAYVYENPKPLNRIQKHLKDLSADKLKAKIQPRYDHTTGQGALWENEDRTA